jgi:Na+/melibiose symporter-like transporter
VRLVARAVLAHRFGFFLVALVPLLFPIGRAEAFIAVIVLMTIPASLVNITFNCLFADVVPESRRPTVISVRMIIASGVVMALTPLFGHWLDTARFPENYQTLYLIGFLMSLLAVRALARIEAPAKALRPAAGPASAQSPRERLAAGLRLIADEKPFRRILVNTVVHVVGNWVANPLYVIYYVRVLGATDGWIGLLASVASLSAMVGYELWRRIIARHGETLPLRVTIVLAGLYPLGIALTHDLNVLLALACLNGLVQPGLNTSHFAVLLRTCPDERRPTYMAIFVTVMNAGAFVGPMVGVALAAAVGINGAIAFGATLWLVGGALFWLFPVRPEGRVGMRA